MDFIEPPNTRTCTSSPEFEFWHPKLEPNFLSADDLIFKGMLLPLQHLTIRSKPEPEQEPEPEPEQESKPKLSEPAESSICSTTTFVSASKRWTDIFKVQDKKKEPKTTKTKKERKASATELNINIWPFSRSRSAGTASGNRPKLPVMRKSSSEPCSRSNSGRRWAASPGRPGGGVHLGRASPVWQPKRAGKRAGFKEKGKKSGLNLTVNSCIRGESIESNGSLFKLRGLFTKKVY